MTGVWNFFVLRTCAVVLLLICSGAANAQFAGVSPTGVNAAFIQLFGTNTTFTSDVDVRVLDKEGKEWVKLPAKLASADQNLRFDLDLSKVVSRDLPEFAISSLQQAGMTDVTSIVRTDKKATFLIYQGAASYLHLPLSPEDAKSVDKGYKLESSKARKELLGDKERWRENVSVKDASGGIALTATRWTAPELKGFPVQIETRQDNMTIFLNFRNVNFEKPEASRFEVPKTYTGYKDMRQMMFAIMKKMVADAAKM